jgi:hypothetical protein
MKINQARNQYEAGGKSSHLLHVDILLPLFLDPADGVDSFLLNVNELSSDYRPLFSGRQSSS